jgi:importin-7
MTLLETIMKKRKKDNLDGFLGFLTSTLNEYAQGRSDARRKDGVLVCLCVLGEELKSHTKYKKQLEPLLVTHVFPEFQSPVGFLRSRAASMTTCFFDIKFKDQRNVAKLMELNLAALRDPCLPVQVEAANSLRNLVELEGTESVVLPILPELLNE